MKTFRFLKAPLAILAAAVLVTVATRSPAQILFSDGSPYTQNFDSLASSGTGNTWEDNTTLQGWYAAKNAGTGGADTQITAYRAITGNDTSGSLDSYGIAGVNPVTERALGSLGSNATGNQGYGVRFVNDTLQTITNIVVSYTGEQWRCNGNTATQFLTFAYRISSVPFTGPDVGNAQIWTAVSALNFATLQNFAAPLALDGNATTNRTPLTATLTGAKVEPNEEIFFRWFDANDVNNDHGIALDDLSITWTSTVADTNKPSITLQPQNQKVTVSAKATFTVAATGKSPLYYQWYLTNNINAGLISGANDSSYSVTYTATNDANGTYFCIVTNSLGSVTSSNANLTVISAIVTNIAYLRSLIDTNYDLTDPVDLYQTEGICVSPVNMVSGGPVFSFFLEDPVSHKGIDVFNRGGYLSPLPGDDVVVSGTLVNFNGTFEVNPVSANPADQVTINSSGNALPPPNILNLASNNNPVYLDALEGTLCVVSNVYLVTSDIIFGTNALETANTVILSNALGQTFTMFVGAYANDMQGQPVPAFCKSIQGILGQNDPSSPYTSGYDLLVATYAELEIPPTNTTPTPIPLNIQVFGTNAVLSWTNSVFNLQSASVVTGTYTTIGGASSPYTNPATGLKFYRLISQ